MKQTQFIKLHVFHKNLGTDQTKEKRLTQAPHHTKYVLDGDLKKKFRAMYSCLLLKILTTKLLANSS